MSEPIVLDEIFEVVVPKRSHGGEGRQFDWLPEATFADVAEARSRDARGETHRELAAIRQETQRSFSYVALNYERS